MRFMEVTGKMQPWVSLSRILTHPKNKIGLHVVAGTLRQSSL